MDLFNMIFIIIALAAALGIVVTNRKHLAFVQAFYTSRTRRNKAMHAKNESMDYGVYQMKTWECMRALLLAAGSLAAVGYVFYRSILLAMLLTPIALFYPQIRIKRIIKKRQAELKLQFRDALHSLSASMQAGRAFESAIRGAIGDLLIQYEADAFIIQELEIIARKLEANETIERAFKDFADRSKLDEIQGFAEILDICKRTGGNLIMAIKSSTDIIADKIEVQNDIAGILAQKKLEQYILAVMPIVLVVMLSASAEEFMRPVFTELAGRGAMTLSILLFIGAFFIAEKITNIEV